MKYEDNIYEEIADEERMPPKVVAIALVLFVCGIAGIFALVGWLLKG